MGHTRSDDAASKVPKPSLAPDGPPAPQEADVRADPLSHTPVVVVRGRQGRPNLPTTDCPFCPGGLEAPQPYLVHWFKNRWPPLPAERCELVLFSPEHDQSLGSLDHEQLQRVIELWTQRTKALGGRPDVAYVLIFENRGAEVGATISHPHGQIYGFEVVPPVPMRELQNEVCALCDEMRGCLPAGPTHGRRLVTSAPGWQAWAAWAPSYPYELVVAPDEHVADLASAAAGRSGLASVLKVSLTALDRLFDEPMPYMLWCHQRPTDGKDWPLAHLHFHVAPIRRGRGVTRYVASGELGSGVMFNPIDPIEAAKQLRGRQERASKPVGAP